VFFEGAMIVPLEVNPFTTRITLRYAYASATTPPIKETAPKARTKRVHLKVFRKPKGGVKVAAELFASAKEQPPGSS